MESHALRSTRPPRLAELLVSFFVDSESREFALGDLAQEFAERHARRGRLAARCWYWGQALRALVGGRRARRSAGPTGAKPSGAQVPGNGRRFPYVGDIAEDIRFGARMLRKRPLFTLTAAATLAVGITAMTAVFSVANALLLRPAAGLAEPSRLADVAQVVNDRLWPVPYALLPFLRLSSESLDDLAGYRTASVSLRDDSGARVVGAMQVSGNYFSVLGVQPSLGRFFASHESFYPRVADEAVISHSLWQARFGGSEDVLGRGIFVNGYAVRIIGVAPAGFGGHQVPLAHDLWMPLGLPLAGLPGPEEIEAFSAPITSLIGRLAPGATLDAAHSELHALADGFSRDHGFSEPLDVRVEPYGGAPLADRATLVLFFTLLMVLVAMVHAIACTNVANMLLARATERRREIAIRASLGAGRGRILRQLLVESSMLFLLSGIAGIVLTAWTMSVLAAPFFPDLASQRLVLDLRADGRVLAFALGTAGLSGLIFGLAPALAATRSTFHGGLRAVAAGAKRRVGQRFLVGLQAAVMMVLLAGAGLLLRSLGAVQAIDLGYDVQGMHVVELDVELAGYGSAAAGPVYERLLEKVRAIPGVASAATSRWAPLRGPGVVPVRDAAAGSAADAIRVAFDQVSAGFFETTGVTLLAGRAFTVADDAGGRLVAVVNRALADRFWPGGSAVGKRLRAGGMARGEFEIVGVVADHRYGTLFGPVPMKVYVTAAQRPHHATALLVRTADIGAVAPAIRAALAEIDPDVPVIEIRSAESYVADFLTGRRIAAWVAGVVGLVGLVLGAVGVYGVTAFVATQRRREIGVRLALGATGSDVVGMMLASGMRAPLIGMAIGTFVALATARSLGALLYGVGAFDPLTYTAVAFAVCAAAALAILVPSRRAAALDPVDTLRVD